MENTTHYKIAAMDISFWNIAHIIVSSIFLFKSVQWGVSAEIGEQWPLRDFLDCLSYPVLTCPHTCNDSSDYMSFRYELAFEGHSTEKARDLDIAK